MRHTLGLQYDVSIASLLGLLHAMVIEISYHECGTFLAKSRCFSHSMPYLEHHISMGQGT